MWHRSSWATAVFRSENPTPRRGRPGWIWHPPKSPAFKGRPTGEIKPIGFSWGDDKIHTFFLTVGAGVLSQVSNISPSSIKPIAEAHANGAKEDLLPATCTSVHLLKCLSPSGNTRLAHCHEQNVHCLSCRSCNFWSALRMCQRIRFSMLRFRKKPFWKQCIPV